MDQGKNNLLWGLAILAAAIYFAWMAVRAIRSGEIARFNGNMLGGMMMDMTADMQPRFRSLKYITRADNPGRFWTAVVGRIFLAVVGLPVALYFLLVLSKG